jgi:hypothetical protein
MPAEPLLKRRPTLPQIVERVLLFAVLAATFVATLLVSKNRWAPTQEPTTFALFFWKWLILYYVAVALGVLSALVGILWTWRLAWLPRCLMVATAAAVFGITLTLNRNALETFPIPGEVPLSACGVTGLGLLTALLVILATLAPWGWRWRLRGAALLGVLAALASFWPRTAQEAPAELPVARLSSERFLLIGIDGADWLYLEALIDEGSVPNLAALRARGAWGSLATIRPTDSPPIWTTIATGIPPRRHGVQGFTSTQLSGVQEPLRRLRPLPGLGVETLHAWLTRGGWVYAAPITRFSRKVPAYWNIASAFGSPVSVLNWWATWPAENVLGQIVSERVHFSRLAAQGFGTERRGVVSPEALAGSVDAQVMGPDEVTYEQAHAFMDVTPEEFRAMAALPFERKVIGIEFPHIYSMFETNRRVAHLLLERSRQEYGRPHDMLALFRIVDLSSHSALRFSELVAEHPHATPDELARYGRVVTEAYRSIDAAVGELVEAFGDGNVIVVSDHGFRLEGGSPNTRAYGHRQPYPGIFIAAGPAFRSGTVEGLSVFDIFPMLLYLKGLPIPEDLELNPVPFAQSFRDALPVQRIASYGVMQHHGEASERTGADERMLERLRAVGYIN